MAFAEDLSARELDLAISRIADGDKTALAELYRLIAAQVYSYSLSVLKNRHDAEDVTQELLLEVWKSAPNYKSAGKPAAWVISIARNLCRMKLRERSRFSEKSDEDILEILGAGPYRFSPEDRAVVRACFGLLGEREREVVIMHAVAGLKHREIAEILKQPISTVISRYNKAIKKLGKELEGALR